MKCAREGCTTEFAHKPNKKYCSKRCCQVQVQRNHRNRRAVSCKSCGIPTYHTTQTCRKCVGRARGHAYTEMTLRQYLNNYKHLKKGSSKYTSIRLMAKYNNPDLIGLPCQRCGYSLHTDFCHIKAIASFPLSAKLKTINHKNNLLKLCKNCHWEFDNGYLKLSEIV